MNQAVHNYKDGRRGKFLRTSRRKDEKNFSTNGLCLDLACKYSILRQLRFTTLLRFFSSG